MSEENKQYSNPFPPMEEAALRFWEDNKIFEKSVNKEAPYGDYVFYDGPPFGTGEPHYGHILSSVSKDVVPRYWTMRGYRVNRRWGWDCHGLPIENIIEKDMEISGKKQIEEMGIAKFNEACRTRVLEYADIWDKMVRRIGRWVDFQNSYKTMDVTYMESVWWAFKELYNKDLVYEGRRVLLYCPRCETPISNFEVAMDNSYKDVEDTSIFVKFKTTNASERLSILKDVYLLAWTTTPWTLPGNVALAVGENIDYVILEATASHSVTIPNGKLEITPGIYIMAADRLKAVFGEGQYFTELSRVKGKALENLRYEPIYEIPAHKDPGVNSHFVVLGDFVTTEDGTGIVHIAPVYGEDDYKIGLKHNLPIIPNLDEKGHFNDNVAQFSGMYFKKVNSAIIGDLHVRDILFGEQKIKHPYPHCHRCETPLYYSAIPAWFISIDKIRQRMLELNQNISWYPEHLKDGRFAKGIETAPDWNISRNRYFATPMPVWRCDTCHETEVIGSVAELMAKTGETGITDIHMHFVDRFTWSCSKCEGGKMKRIKEVFDCWVESGSMPFAQQHYPFENKEAFEKNFPAQFISEYISQTRAWFYVMHVLSTALFDKNSYEHVVTTGVILNEKGEKMSKSKKNFPDPWKVIDAFGADALRYYLMTSTVMHAENLFFNENEVKDLFRKNLMILWNVYKFYELYAADINPLDKGGQGGLAPEGSNNILDKWILIRFNELVATVTSQMEKYDLPRAGRPIEDFINDLSTWYLRRSRDRLKSSSAKATADEGDDAADKQAALVTMKFVLTELAKVMAPFMPFIAENIWQRVTGHNFQDPNQSVHLEAWPEAKAVAGSEELMAKMKEVRGLVELALSARDEMGIKVRQPLSEMAIGFALPEEYKTIVSEECNIFKITEVAPDQMPQGAEWKHYGEVMAINKEITTDLKHEGMKRELIRHINLMRKDSGLTIGDSVILSYQTDDMELKTVFDKHGDDIKRSVLASEIKKAAGEPDAIIKEVKIEGLPVTLALKKVSL